VREYLEAEGEQFDVIILSRSDFAQKHLSDARQYAPQSHLIFDTVDLHFLREERQARILQDPEVERKATERRDLEHQLIDQADETWVVSPVERDLLLPSHPNQSIEIVSNIVDVPGSAVPFSERRDILFIGSFLHPPNIDAVLFFTREIFPSVREQLVGARFYIIGAKAPPEVVALADEQVIVTGYQPDVTIFFESVRLSVAPLRYGAGVKGKINQSMGFGVPVIATPIAAEGMSVADGEDIIIAEEPLEFARRLIELYQRKELWERISRNGLRKTSDLFSVESARRKLEALFDGSRLSNRDPLQVAAEDSQESVIASSF
jgi:glycosyltransferase involved in cell wall biosynthesis